MVNHRLLVGFALTALILAPGIFPVFPRILWVTAAASAPSDSWPTFHHDISRTGYTSGQAPSSPRILWSYQTARQIETSPVIAYGTVYFSSEDGYFYALNESTGSLLWRVQIGTPGLGSPAIYGGSVYTGGYAGIAELYRLNASTGTKIWNVSVAGVAISILPLNDRICAGAWEVHPVNVGVYCLSVQSGSMLWKFNVTYPTDLAYSDGLLYTSSGASGMVYALNATDGSVAWQYQTPTIVTGGPAVLGGILYAGGFAGSFPSSTDQFFALNARTGGVIWRTNTTANGAPAVAGGVVILNAGNGVAGLNATDGSRIWRFGFRGFGISQSMPAVGGNVAIIGGGAMGGFPDPTIYALDVKTGKLVWSLPVGIAADGSPAISGGIVYVGADDGKLYAITSAESFLSLSTLIYIVIAALGILLILTVLFQKRKRKFFG